MENVLSGKYLTIKEAMQYLKCSHMFLMSKRKSGEIKAINLGERKILLDKESIDKLLLINEHA